MLTPGTFRATPLTVCFKQMESGAIMINFDFQILQPGYENERFTTQQCLMQKDGNLSSIAVKMLRECFGWPTPHPAWFEDSANYQGKEVELVLENEVYKEKERLVCKFINVIGGGRGTTVNGNELANKLGGKLRAVWGSIQAPVKKETPPPAAKPKPSAPPMPPARMSDADAVWAKVQAIHGEGDGATAAWQELIGERDAQEFSPADWGKLLTQLEKQDDNVVM